MGHNRYHVYLRKEQREVEALKPAPTSGRLRDGQSQ